MIPAHLVEYRAALVRGSQLHDFIAQSDMAALLTLLLSLTFLSASGSGQKNIKGPEGRRTTGSVSFAASSSVTLFCTNARLLRNGEGKA